MLQHEAVYLPGHEGVLYQVQQARLRNLEFHGHFRDHLRAQDLGTADVGHARNMVRAIEQIRKRANLLTVSLGKDSWTCLLTEAKFSWEGPQDCLYEIVLAVAANAETVVEAPNATQPQVVPSDLAAQIQADLAEARAKMAALALRANALQLQVTILNIFDHASASARDLTEAVSTLALVNRASASAAAARVDGAGRSVQTQLQTLLKLLATTKPQAIVPDGDPGGLLAWHSASIGASVTATTSIDRARSLRGHARSRVTKASRVYVVRTDDTLESIAASELGDRSRAGELGVRSDELRPGLNIRIPEAS